MRRSLSKFKEQIGEQRRLGQAESGEVGTVIPFGYNPLLSLQIPV